MPTPQTKTRRSFAGGTAEIELAAMLVLYRTESIEFVLRCA